jgi:hypothetical protein
MMSLASLRLATLVICSTLAFATAIPARAQPDRQGNQMLPNWLDQTIYQPNCISADCACDCRSERLCLPACVGW